MRLPGFGGWSQDPLWSHVYPRLVGHGRLGALAWRAGLGSDVRLLHEAAAEIGTLPAGSRVLDIPSGSGVALRGLRPGQDVQLVAADISATMLERTMALARELSVEDQVTPVVADVGALPWDDASFDLVVSLTGLHCFPDPRLAIEEMLRVLRPGGVLTGSSLFTDTGPRYVPLQVVGRAAGILGPMLTSTQAREWMSAAGAAQVELTLHGGLGYFRAVSGSPPER